MTHQSLILLLSNSSESAAYIADALGRCERNCRVERVADCYSAIAILENRPVDAVVCEYPLMSSDDGLRIPTEMRSASPHCSVIAAISPDIERIPTDELAQFDDSICLRRSDADESLRLAVMRACRRAEAVRDSSHAKACTAAHGMAHPSGVREIAVDYFHPALLRTEAHFRAVFDRAPHGVCLVADDGRPVLANVAMERILGYTAEEITQLNLCDLVYRGESAHLQISIDQRSDRQEREERFVCKDGAIIWAHVVSEALPQSGDIPRHYLVTIANISRRKQAEFAQRESEERFRAIFEQAEIGMVVVDKRGVILEANSAFHEMLGYEENDLLGVRISSITCPEDFCLDSRSFENLLSDKRNVLQIEKRYLHRDGHHVPARVSISLVGHPASEPGITIGMVEDITGLKRAESDIQNRNRELTVLNAASVALSMSQDIPSILSGLRDVFVYQMDLRAGRFLLYSQFDDHLCLEMQWGRDDTEAESIPVAKSRYERVVCFQEPSVVGASGELVELHGSHEDLDLHSLRDLILPLVADEEVQGVVEILDDAGTMLEAFQVSFLKTLSSQIAVAIRKARLIEQARARTMQLRNLSRQLVRVQEDERRHLARELHDEIGSMLTALSIKLQQCSSVCGCNSEEHVEQAKNIVKYVADQVHKLSLFLRPALLDHAGLVPALLFHFETYTSQTHIEVSFGHDLSDAHISSEISTCAFRVIQEALTNIARHAGVSKASVELRVKDDQVVIDVQDEGRGFDLDVALSSGVGVGFAGMRERVYAVEGTFSLVSVPDSGTHVQAVLPLNRKRAGNDKNSHCR